MNFKFEGVEYSITIEEVAIFPQGYAALMTEVGLLQDEPSMLLMDLGGWTVDLIFKSIVLYIFAFTTAQRGRLFFEIQCGTINRTTPFLNLCSPLV